MVLSKDLLQNNFDNSGNWVNCRVYFVTDSSTDWRNYDHYY